MPLRLGLDPLVAPASPRPASSSSSTSTFLSANVAQVPRRRLVPAADRRLVFTLMTTWKQRPRAAVASACATTRIAARQLHQTSASSAADARAGHRGLPDRRPGRGAARAAAQPQAQQGAARAQPVPHRASSRDAVDRRRRALRDRGARPRLLADDAELRLQERARRARARSPSCASTGCAFEDMDTSYFLSRDIVIPTIGGGMARLAREAVRAACTATRPRADFLRLPTNARRRARLEGRESEPGRASARDVSLLRGDRRLRRGPGRLHQLGRDRVPGRDRARRDAGADRPPGCGRSAGAWAWPRRCRRCGCASR